MRELLEPAAGLGLEQVAGAAGLGHLVTLSRVQRPGLALTGHSYVIAVFRQTAPQDPSNFPFVINDEYAFLNLHHARLF